MMRFVCLFLLSVSLYAADDPAAQKATLQLQRAPMRFEPNVGQMPAGARFAARGSESAFLFFDQEVAMKLGKTSVRLAMEGADNTGRFEGLNKLPSTTNYFLGSVKNKWRTGVPNFARLKREHVYPGIDVVYYGADRRLEYDFLVNPGADASRIRLRFSGADQVSLNEQGALVLKAGNTAVLQRIPSAYQMGAGGTRTRVDCRYRLDKDGSVSLALGAYDHDRQLVIDPVLVYAAYIGGTGAEGARVITRDTQGLVYIAGYTSSSDLTAIGNAEQTANKGNQDVFVAIFNPKATDTQILYVSYFGGTGNEDVGGITVDSAGAVYLTGVTTSSDLPTANAYSTSSRDYDAFVAKIDPTQSGSAGLAYSTYIGGTGAESGHGITLDPTSGLVYITGYTASNDYPLAGDAFQASNNGSWDAFVSAFDLTKSGAGTLVYSSYLGGEAQDNGRAILVDKTGTVYVSGITYSSGFPVTDRAYQKSYKGAGDGFLVTLRQERGILYGTYLGGAGIEDVKRMVFDGAGRVVMTGYTTSQDFPLTSGAPQSKYGGLTDAFVSVLDLNAPPNQALTYSTYLGGGDGDVAYDVKVDALDKIYVAGYTLSADFPVTPDAYTPNTGGQSVNGFAAIIDRSAGPGKGLLYATYISSPGYQVIFAMDIDPSGTFYLTGSSTGSLFPNGPPQSNGAGNADAFLMVLQR